MRIQQAFILPEFPSSGHLPRSAHHPSQPCGDKSSLCNYPVLRRYTHTRIPVGVCLPPASPCPFDTVSERRTVNRQIRNLLSIGSGYRLTINHVLSISRFLQPMCIQQDLIFQDFHRQPICHDLPIVHHNCAREQFLYQPHIMRGYQHGDWQFTQ
jgi:hypothetical protein